MAAEEGVAVGPPHSVRHTLPTENFLCWFRNLEEIQKRGRWRSFASVARYKKAARITADYQKHTATQRLLFEDCARNLRKYVLGPEVAPEPSNL